MDTGRSSDSVLALPAVWLYILYLVVVLLLLALECKCTRYYCRENWRTLLTIEKNDNVAEERKENFIFAKSG